MCIRDRGLEGKKGVLWWSIRETLEAKKPPFVLLENVDRLLKSPAKQRGRDFGVILACFRDEGYTVEWRVINAAEYGYQQRRRRIFIFAYKDDTNYAKTIIDKENYSINDTEENKQEAMEKVILTDGFFAKDVYKRQVVDPKKESICVQEAHTLGIPLVGIADTNSDPEELDYIIPGNDDAIRAVKLITSAMADAVIEANQGIDADSEEVAEDAE